MATDFFRQQDIARRNTGRLVLLFVSAVLAIVVSVLAFAAALIALFSRDPATNAPDWVAATDPQRLILILVATLVVVVGGSLVRIAELRAGGRLVAEELGGRLLSPNTSEPAERRLLNVVEEMAIASGISAPPVYLMDGEAGINAFAAGLTPEDAVVGITRGAATALDRDELQGVIAHEFSHILNGDMRLNLRLMGMLHGIFLIGAIGYVLLRVRVTTLVVIGASLSVLGFSGTFFGNLIKAAVSRQREFLADASAVQFTRQPGGIAGALKKIGGLATGSRVESPNAPQASHMFFGRATSGLNAVFSTHPPLEERITRIEPSWDGEFPELPAEVIEALTAASPVSTAEGEARAVAGGDVATAVSRVGQPTFAHLQYAAELIDGLPEPVVQAAREPYGARAAVYALLLDPAPEPRRSQLRRLEAAADQGVYEETLRLAPCIEQLGRRMRLPLLEIALPALRVLSSWQYRRFQENLVDLVEADDVIDLFEWSLQRILLRDMQASFGRLGPRRVRHASVRSVASSLAVLMSVLAYVGDRNPQAAERAFAAGWRVLSLPEWRLLPHEACGFTELDAALVELDRSLPQVKKRTLKAAAACITADRQVTVDETELLRAVSASMSCPMPPILRSS
ncbi:MAG: M48 family metallopeptidase [Holophagales bacterium]|nr:M48 family metallopeptidase [Holophagales bacterium]MYG31029.1 M48 family metallopeptidase [Holophagales bacterium]MYI80153.1 M48 family metallopeptidase [Holophagales bacterium]